MGLFAGTPFDRPPQCPECDKLEAECVCPPPQVQAIPPEKQSLRVAVEKRKQGKMVTVIRDLADQPAINAELLTRLKSTCGAGGTCKENIIEIQGNQLERVRTTLTSLGYRLRK